jgi:hypothetical protein
MIWACSLKIRAVPRCPLAGQLRAGTGQSGDGNIPAIGRFNNPMGAPMARKTNV